MRPKQLMGRRTFLHGAGSIAIASVIAGCTTGGSSSSGNGGNGPTSVDEWLSETENYDGTITDQTGTKSVTVEVGPGQSELTFAPAAIEISPETTVTWKWIGGGSHNVVATDGQFDSGAPESSGSFEYSFETTGTFYYYCDPHRSMGMKGAVVVADTSTGSGTNNETGNGTTTEANDDNETSGNTSNDTNNA